MSYDLYPSTTTTSNTTNAVVIPFPVAKYRPEDHPDYKDALAGNRSFDGLVCRHCGIHSDDASFSYSETVTGSQWGYLSVYAKRDGTVDGDREYAEDTDIDTSSDTEYTCCDCDTRCDTLAELLIACPERSEAEIEADEWPSAFVRSIQEGRLIVFDDAEWQEQEAERLREAKMTRLQRDRAALAELQVRIAQAEHEDDLPF